MTTDETLDHHAEVSAAVGLFVMHVVVVSKPLMDREALPCTRDSLPREHWSRQVSTQTSRRPMPEDRFEVKRLTYFYNLQLVPH